LYKYSVKKYIIMIQIVETYNKYVKSLPDLIHKSDYKAEYFMRNLELKHATYYRKLREKNFTVDEVNKITELLFPEELLYRELEKSEEDIKAGRVEDFDFFMGKLRMKYNF
jgi:predicted transcriptional regulator